MRAIRTAGAAVAVLLALSGCSKSSPTATQSTPPPSATTSPSPSPSPSKTTETDGARARAIVLTDADFPIGWQGSAHTEEATDKEFERRFKACSGITEQGGTADVFGDDFDMNPASVGSEASFFRTATLAHADFSTINNPRAIPCARRILADLLKAELVKQGIKGVTLSGVSLVRIAAPHYGDESAGLRLTGTLSGGGQSLRFFQDILVARKGRAEVTGSFFDFGRLFPVAQERSLFGKLGARLVADGGV